VTHLALVGPTASGKSALALAAAYVLGDVEIVSIDSMQIYRGMDVGTAKPSAHERAAVHHHLVDIAEPSDDWSVARFQCVAREAVADIERRGKRALLVGGTGLYLQAVIDPLTFPPEDRAIRARFEQDVGTAEGLVAASADLHRHDPVAASRIEPGNARRVVRALEVMRVTSRPFSSFGPGIQSYGDTVFPVCIVGLSVPNNVLDRCIEERVGAMRDAGLVEEVRALAAHGALSRTARQAIGYKEILAYLEGDEPSVDAAFEETTRRTKRFARRQVRWFRRDPRITWLPVGENPCNVLPSLLALWD
jgi:tRNA dimethylallyltransferase